MTPDNPSDHQPNHRPVDVTLKDGRRIAYAEYGDPAGTPVLFQSGTFHSRLLPGRVTVPQGIRLIAIDRAGIGDSDATDNRSFAQSAADTNSVADSLGLKSYTLLGWSSGSSHAMGCAAHFPERVQRLGLVAALPPWLRKGALRDMDSAWVMMGRASNLSVRFPILAPVVKSQIRSTVLSPKEILKLLSVSPPDADAVNRHQASIMVSYTEAVKAGPDGVIGDIMTFVKPWDFEIADIHTETIVWHGAFDRICPHGADYILATIPGSRQITFANGGHLALLDHWDDILQGLVA